MSYRRELEEARKKALAKLVEDEKLIPFQKSLGNILGDVFSGQKEWPTFSPGQIDFDASDFAVAGDKYDMYTSYKDEKENALYSPQQEEQFNYTHPPAQANTYTVLKYPTAPAPSGLRAPLIMSSVAGNSDRQFGPEQLFALGDRPYSIFLGNLSQECSEEFLEDALRTTIEEDRGRHSFRVRLCRDKKGNPYGFIVVPSKIYAYALVDRYNGICIDHTERPIRLELASANNVVVFTFNPQNVSRPENRAPAQELVELLRQFGPVKKMSEEKRHSATGKLYFEVEFADEWSAEVCYGRLQEENETSPIDWIIGWKTAIDGIPRFNHGDARVLFISGLHPNVSDADLRAVFGKYGKIKHLSQLKRLHRKIGIVHYCHLTFSSLDACDSAIRYENGKWWYGQTMTVEYKVPREGYSPTTLETPSPSPHRRQQAQLQGGGNMIGYQAQHGAQHPLGHFGGAQGYAYGHGQGGQHAFVPAPQGMVTNQSPPGSSNGHCSPSNLLAVSIRNTGPNSGAHPEHFNPYVANFGGTGQQGEQMGFAYPYPPVQYHQPPINANAYFGNATYGPLPAPYAPGEWGGQFSGTVGGLGAGGAGGIVQAGGPPPVDANGVPMFPPPPHAQPAFYGQMPPMMGTGGFPGYPGTPPQAAQGFVVPHGMPRPPIPHGMPYPQHPAPHGMQMHQQPYGAVNPANTAMHQYNMERNLSGETLQTAEEQQQMQQPQAQQSNRPVIVHSNMTARQTPTSDGSTTPPATSIGSQRSSNHSMRSQIRFNSRQSGQEEDFGGQLVVPRVRPRAGRGNGNTRGGVKGGARTRGREY